MIPPLASTTLHTTPDIPFVVAENCKLVDAAKFIDPYFTNGLMPIPIATGTVTVVFTLPNAFVASRV